MSLNQKKVRYLVQMIFPDLSVGASYWVGFPIVAIILATITGSVLVHLLVEDL